MRIAAGLVALLCVAPVAPALADFDGIAECEAFAVQFYKAHGSDLRSVTIERPSIIENRFDDNVGSQRVSTEYIGWVDADWGDRTSRDRFVCLHAGAGDKPVYFGFVPLQ